MSTLVDHQIRYLCRTHGLVEPFNPDMVNPASIDVTLGDHILVEAPEGGFFSWNIADETYELPPGGFVLAATAEWIRVPNSAEAQFQLKSSRGREGYQHALAGYIDPGFCGRVTLELSNLRRYVSLPLRAGMRIGQLRFSELASVPLRSYSVTGRYQNSEDVEESKG